MNQATDEQPQWMITNACTKQTGIEMHFDAPGGETVVHGRFLSKLKDTIEFEVPVKPNKAFEFGEGTAFTGFFVASDEAFEFTGTVSGSEPVEGNPKAVKVLATKAGVRSVQRRKAFRTEFSGFYSVPVVMVATQEDEAAGPGTKKLATGEIQDASALGIAVVLEGHKGTRHKPGTRMFATFSTELDPRPFALLCVLEHVREFSVTIYEGDTERTENKTSLGFRLVEWPNQVDFGKEMTRFERIVNHVQRERRKTMAARSPVAPVFVSARRPSRDMPTDHAQQLFEIACTEHAPVEVHVLFDDGFASAIEARLVAQCDGGVTVEFTGACADLGDVRIGNRYTATLETEGATLSFCGEVRGARTDIGEDPVRTTVELTRGEVLDAGEADAGEGWSLAA
ncbi:unnamed protein product [Symbiodinium necroappetens]|uniref:Uncharacterized protein n=1 Tax=Symbiodinium necroappetens TaxID=1628268 RepID=A0A812KUU3_9DINO|nr:unnamed protein product [Symbiodinium necroappetens]